VINNQLGLPMLSGKRTEETTSNTEQMLRSRRKNFDWGKGDFHHFSSRTNGVSVSEMR